MPKASASKPVTVTLKRIEAKHPCWSDYGRFLKRVGGVPSDRYVDSILKLEYACSCRSCIAAMARDRPDMGQQINRLRKAVKIDATAPIPVESIYKMSAIWGNWTVQLVLNSAERKRWYARND